MTTSLILHTLHEYKQYIESQGFFVYAVMLKGSQNYNLDDSESDIDANAIIIPTPSQIRKDLKFKFNFPTGEVTAHNIYSFAEIVAKGNPQWIEVCNTEYHIGESLDIFKHYKVNPSALKGMVMEKVVAFDKLYPSRAVYVEKYGYDPKQLSNIIRLYDVLSLGVPNYSYPDGPERDHMLDIKRGRFPVTKEQAFLLRDEYIAKLSEIYETKKIEYTPQPVNYELLDSIVLDYYKKLK